MTQAPIILSIDDDRDFQEVLKTALTARGFTVETALTSAAGIERAKELIPDVILMDVQMPEKDGIATATEILASPRLKNLKIIFLTNLGATGPMATDINRKFARQMGAIDYFKKGADFEELAKEIQKLLESKL